MDFASLGSRVDSSHCRLPFASNEVTVQILRAGKIRQCFSPLTSFSADLPMKNVRRMTSNVVKVSVCRMTWRNEFITVEPAVANRPTTCSSPDGQT
jgi:hypothetical protein